MKIIPKEIKRRARATLCGHYFPAVNMALSLTLFTTALSLLVSASGLYASPGALNQALYWILYGITLLLGALLETGLVRFLYFLNKKQPLRERGALFFAFRNQADSYILSYAFRYLVTLIWFLPALYYYMRIPLVIDLTDLPSDLAFNAGMALLLALAALVPAVLLALPWCLATYVLLDKPELSAAEALRISRRLTRGQRGRIFLLWLSFLPLCILGLGSFGIGFLWIQPYFHTAMGEVYLELSGQRAKPEAPEPEAAEPSPGSA